MAEPALTPEDAAESWEDSEGQGRGADRRAAGAPILSVEGFEGPLDFLLEMVRRQKVSLGQVSIKVLCDQFVAALEASAGRVALDRQADWVVMASELVRLKAQLLMPVTPEAAAAAEEEAKRTLRQWEALRVMRAAAAWLAARPQLGRDVFARGDRPRAARPQAELLVAFLEATLAWMEPRLEARGAEPPVYRPSPPDVWTLPEALARLRQALRSQPAGGALWSLGLGRDAPASPLRRRSAVASTFLAGLELARQEEVTLRQDRAFGPILLAARPRQSATAA
jgi:segregation and condensation protein A